MSALLMIEFCPGEFGAMKGWFSEMRCFQTFLRNIDGELDRMNAWFIEPPRFTSECGSSCLAESVVSDLVGVSPVDLVP